MSIKVRQEELWHRRDPRFLPLEQQWQISMLADFPEGYQGRCFTSVWDNVNKFPVFA